MGQLFYRNKKLKLLTLIYDYNLLFITEFNVKKFFLCCFSLFIVYSFQVGAQPTNQKPYVVILGPSDLNQVHVNIANYQPTAKPVKRTEINFGDGSVSTNTVDVFHRYTSNGKHTISVKSWDNKDVLTSYSEVVDVSVLYQVKDLPNTRLLGPLAITQKKSYKLDLTTAQANKLYQLTLSKQSSAGAMNCKRDFQVVINSIPVFNGSEVSCNTTQLQRFVVLDTENIIQLDSLDPSWKAAFQIEIHAVEIDKNIDKTAPVISSNLGSNSLTRSPILHISINDLSETTTYVWNGSQQLVLATNSKEFDLAMAEGRNDFVLQSVDFSGNTSAYFYLTNIGLDTTSPTISTSSFQQHHLKIAPPALRRRMSMIQIIG